MFGDYSADDSVCGLDDNWWAAVLREAETSEPHSGPDRSPHGGADPLDDWSMARRLCESEDAVELEVVGYNRGGLLVNL